MRKIAHFFHFDTQFPDEKKLFLKIKNKIQPFFPLEINKTRHSESKSFRNDTFALGLCIYCIHETIALTEFELKRNG